jgi:hypothetical protein
MWQQLINTRPFISQPDMMLPLAMLNWLAEGDALQAQACKTYRDYYEGEHPTQLTDRMREFLEVTAGSKFDLNFIPVAVDVFAERLTVVGFAADGQGGRFTAVTDADNPLVVWWNRNRMDGIQKSVHTAMTRDGDTYAIVEWDNETGIPSLTHELAWDGSQGVRVHYSNERSRKISYAVKRWNIDEGMGTAKYQRANVYYPDRIEKFIMDIRRGNWQPYNENEGTTWPIPWVTSDGRPLGVPVIHFALNRRGYNYGKSRVHDLIPIQDGLNKAAIDELAVADVEGFGLITLTGDDPGELTVAPRQIIYAEKPDAEWGHIPAGDISGLTALVDAYIRRAAQLSRTPLNYFQVTGQVASDKTQGADESVLVSAIESAATDIGNSWEDAMIMARRLWNTFGGGGLDEDVTISTIWGPFERVDALGREKLRADIVGTLTGAGVALQGALKAALYDDDMVAIMMRGDWVDGEV